MAYDLAILGSGGAAFAAAIHAARRGRRVAMVEQGDLGGTCVNVGCIPSKALLAAADARATAAGGRFPGIRTEAAPVDMAALSAGKNEIVAGLRTEKYEDLVDEYGWEVIRGSGRFTDGLALQVDGRRIEAEHYLIATGSLPWAPPVDGLDDVDALDSTSAMDLERVPESPIVVGGTTSAWSSGSCSSASAPRSRS